MNQETIRKEQIEAGRRQLSTEQGSGSNVRSIRHGIKSKPSAQPLKGHEAFLKALETSGATVSFEKVSSGVIVTGIVKHSDKFTVSVTTPEATRVLFKHDISEFWAVTPRAEAA